MCSLQKSYFLRARGQEGRLSWVDLMSSSVIWPSKFILKHYFSRLCRHLLTGLLCVCRCKAIKSNKILVSSGPNGMCFFCARVRLGLVFGLDVDNVF